MCLSTAKVKKHYSMIVLQRVVMALSISYSVIDNGQPLFTVQMDGHAGLDSNAGQDKTQRQELKSIQFHVKIPRLLLDMTHNTTQQIQKNSDIE